MTADPAARQPADALLARLGRLHPKIIDLSLGRIERLLGALGDPHRKLPPVLHVAGTNGKGSVVATARAIAEAAGLRVHAYTSPHLVRFHERIRLAGRLIGDDALEAVLQDCERANGGEPITFFEITTAAAFLAFSRAPADLAIIEVGLGGRLDATNVISDPAGVAITPVSYDHQEYLGHELSDIAREKAGIIKPQAPVILGPQLGIVEQVVRRTARQQAAPLYAYGRHWRAGMRTGKNGETRLVYKDELSALDLPAPALSGPHQASNAGTAIALLRHQSAVAIPEAAIRAGLGWVRWPARLQRLAGGPLAARLPKGSELWLDGGHNPAAARALKEAFFRLDTAAQPFILIVGMQANRDPLEFLLPFAGMAEAVYGVAAKNVDAPLPAAQIAAAATDLGLNGRVAANPAGALDAIARNSGGRPVVVLICGSLYLAGEVLAATGMPPA